MGEGWVGVCAKVRMWRSAAGHLWGVGSLLSPLVLRRCDLAERLHLPCWPLPLTPALFVSHSLPFSKRPSPPPRFSIYWLLSFLSFLCTITCPPLLLSFTHSPLPSFSWPYSASMTSPYSELLSASRQSLGTSVPLWSVLVSKASTPAVSFLSAPLLLVPSPGDKMWLEHPEQRNHLTSHPHHLCPKNASSSDLNVVSRAHVQVLMGTGVALGLSKVIPSDSNVT